MVRNSTRWPCASSGDKGMAKIPAGVAASVTPKSAAGWMETASPPPSAPSSTPTIWPPSAPSFRQRLPVRLWTPIGFPSSISRSVLNRASVACGASGGIEWVRGVGVGVDGGLGVGAGIGVAHGNGQQAPAIGPYSGGRGWMVQESCDPAVARASVMPPSWRSGRWWLRPGLLRRC